MKTEIIYRKEMIGRAVLWLKESGLVPEGSHVESCCAELETVKTELDVAAGRQAGAHLGFREHAVRRAAASADLHQWMADLARIARSLPVEKHPGVAERFRLPRSQSYQEQHASALAFIKALRELEPVFAPRGFDEDAIAQAEALIAKIESANGAKISRFLSRIEHTHKLMLLSRRGLAIVREIDAIFQRLLRPAPALLAEWNSIRHVRRPWKKRAAKAPQVISPEEVQAAEPGQSAAPASLVLGPELAPVFKLAPAAVAASG